MIETRRLLEAATALSNALRTSGVPHAFHGSIFIAVLTNNPQADVTTPAFSPHFLLSIRPTLCFSGNFLYRRRRARASVPSCQAGPDRQRGPVHHALSLE